MKAICPICKKEMRITEKSKNVMIVDDQYVHKKCPSTGLTKEEKEQRRKLVDRISYHIINNPCEPNKQFNWMRINVLIKRLKDMGYSYEEQLYTLDKVVAKQNNKFWGYGAVENNIAGIVFNKRKTDALAKEMKSKLKKENKQKERMSKSKILDDDIDW